jgi:hypothetical protein
MIVYIKEPKASLATNILHNGPLEQIESSYDPKFEDCQDLEAIKSRLRHMEDNGLHIKNGRNMVFRSAFMIEMIVKLETQPDNWYTLHTLTRTAGLRSAVASFLPKD